MNLNLIRTNYFAVLAFFSLTATTYSYATEHVVFISCDGARADAITACGPKLAPAFFRIRSEGSYTDNARTDANYTTTLQNHTSMISGRGVKGDAGHHWTDNGNPKLGQHLHKNRGEYIASVFDVAHDHGLKTLLFASKSKFSVFDVSYDERRGAADKVGANNGRDKIDNYLSSTSTERLVDSFIEELGGRKPPHFAMLHLVNPDSAGHGSGWNISSKNSPYMKSIAKVDSFVGRIMKTIENSPRLRGNTVLIITSDHGGALGTKGHEQSSRIDNYRIPFYVWGRGVQRGAELYSLNRYRRLDPAKENPQYDDKTQPIRSGEVGNLALNILGLPPIPGSTINVKQDLIIGLAPEMTSNRRIKSGKNGNSFTRSLPTVRANPIVIAVPVATPVPTTETGTAPVYGPNSNHQVPKPSVTSSAPPAPTESKVKRAVRKFRDILPNKP